MTGTVRKPDTSELEWVQLRKDMKELGPDMMNRETVGQLVWRKAKENPLVPFGLIATCASLVFGIRAFVRGDSKRSNLFMRYRVSFQIFTVAAATTSMYLAQKRINERERNSENLEETKNVVQ